MIISRTPLRISFAGGMTDIPKYYEKDYGAVTSTTINKYVYVTVNEKFIGKSRIAYKKYEEVDSVDQISHPIIRECLKYLNIKDKIEITTIADIPGGTGLGSSSAFTVGLLNALHKYKGYNANPKELAEEACHIEIDILKEPIGKQDQTAVAFGGLNHIIFTKDEVEVKPILLPERELKFLDTSLSLHYTNKTRSASNLLKKQALNMDYMLLLKMRAMAENMYQHLKRRDGNFKAFGECLNQAWKLKRQIDGVSNDIIDGYYEKARYRGALGGKLCGAGSGGFLLIMSDLSKQWNTKTALADLKELKFNFEKDGSKIVYES